MDRSERPYSTSWSARRSRRSSTWLPPSPFLLCPWGSPLAAGSLEAGLLVRILSVFMFASLVVLPALFVAGFFASVLVLHAFIRLVAGRDQKGLPATLRVSCYAVGAPVAVAWIPAGRHPGRFLLLLPARDRPEAGAQDLDRQVSRATLMLVTLLFVLATIVVVYDYSLIREAMK